MKISKEIISIVILVIVLAIIFPFIALLILHNPSSVGIGELDSWINFYGSYFGAILSGIITLLIIKITLGIEKSKIYRENEGFKKFFIDEYIPFTLVQVNSAIEIINRDIKDEVVYIPYHELIIEPNYYENVSKLDINFSDKYELLSILHDIKSLNYLVRKSEESRSMQNSIMLNKNIDIIRTKALIISQSKDDDFKSFQELSNIDKLYEEAIYPEIKSDAVKYLQFADSLINRTNIIMKKYKKQ